MHTLTELQELFSKALNEQKFRDEPHELYEPMDYILTVGGKRLRPVLTLMACDLFGGDLEKALSPALGIELFHNFTLIHDDIMDKAPMRRNKQTVHEKYNSNIAILSGDVMFVYAYKYICGAEKQILEKILSVFNETATMVCEGQQYDMSFEKRNEVTIAEYLKMIGLKTASLLAGALKIGAFVGGASFKDAQNFSEGMAG